MLAELDEEYAAIARRLGVAVARLWHGGQLVRPSTWVLSLELRSVERRAHGIHRLRRPMTRAAVGVSWLDVKLGLRMLVKHPGSTLVAVVTLAIGIPVGLVPMHIAAVAETAPPVAESDRLYALRYVDLGSSRPLPAFIDHFEVWRDELDYFESVAFVSMNRRYNVIVEDGQAAPVPGAAVTPSMFEALRVPPFLGRALIAADNEPGAPPVVVIAHDLWQSRLAGDESVIGRTVSVGGESRTVVGVMPEDFHHPHRDRLWLPIRDNVGAGGESPGRAGTPLVFGRLKDGATPEQARAQFEAIHDRLTAEHPEIYERLEPQVVPFTIALLGHPEGGLRGHLDYGIILAVGFLLLLVACANVGVLIFARTAARSAELAVRTALGASRRRVLAQLFSETLVLAVLAAGVGLLVADRVVVDLLVGLLDTQPYWVDYGVTTGTMAWALVLAAVSASVAGTLPGLRVTRAGVRHNVQRHSTGGTSPRFGRGSHALIVGNVALAVVTVGVGVFVASGLADAYQESGVSSRQYLTARLTIPSAAVPGSGEPFDMEAYLAGVVALEQDFVRRLSQYPEIRAVAAGTALPGLDYPATFVEVEGDAQAGSGPAPFVRIARVDPGFFDALERPILGGRGFDLADLDGDFLAAIVTTSFADQVMRGRNPIGRRFRQMSRRGEPSSDWYEIVGLVDDGVVDGNLNLGTYGLDRTEGGVYLPFNGRSRIFRFAVRVGEDAAGFAPRLREIVGEIDSSYLVSEPEPLEDVVPDSQEQIRAVLWGTGILIVVLVGLSISGVYALMSFTVTARRREIGIRAALGADRRTIALVVAHRPLAQLAAGVLLGAPFTWWILDLAGAYLGRFGFGGSLVTTLLLAACVLAVIAGLACTAPTMRALNVMPTEALRSD